MTEYLLLTKRDRPDRAGWLVVAYVKADEPPQDWKDSCEEDIATGFLQEYKIINLTLDQVVTAR